MLRGASWSGQGCSSDGLPLGFLLKQGGIRGAGRAKKIAEEYELEVADHRVKGDLVDAIALL